MKYANSFIAEERDNKTKYLHKALDQTNNIIQILEIEKTRLQNILDTLSQYKEIHTAAA